MNTEPVTTAQATTSAEIKTETKAVDTKAAETKVPDAKAVDTKAAETAAAKEATDKATQSSMVTATEVKTEIKTDAKKDDPEAKGKEAKPAVPEKYDLKLPKDSKLGADVVAKIETLAKEKGWSNERAQEAVEERSSWEAEREQIQSQHIQHLNDKIWKEELASDPEVGGQKFEESGHFAHKAAERFGGKPFADQLKAMKLNHQPMLFKFLVNVGKAMESDKAIIHNLNPGSGALPKEQQMYPGMFKKES